MGDVYKDSDIKIPLAVDDHGTPICPHCGNAMVADDDNCWACPLGREAMEELRQATDSVSSETGDEG